MRFFLMLLCLNLMIFFPAWSNDELFERFDRTGYIKQRIVFSSQGVRVDPKCAKEEEYCQALLAHKRKPKFKVPKRAGTKGHPANDFCVSIEGRPVLLLDKHKNQRNFCEFTDGSLIDSWQLFDRAEKKP